MLSLRFSEETYPEPFEVPEHLVFHLTGRLVYTDVDDAGEPVETAVGTFAVTVLDIEGANAEGISVFDLCDLQSSTMDCFDSLFDADTDEITPEVSAMAFGPDYYPMNLGVLLIERLVIFAEHRGKGFGLMATAMLLMRFRSSVGLVALKPYPLQFEVKSADGTSPDGTHLDPMSFGLSQEDATNKLSQHYARLGFKSVRETAYMVMNSLQTQPFTMVAHS